MEENNSLLRNIPKVDDLLRLPRISAAAAGLPANRLVVAIRTVLEEIRQECLCGLTQEIPPLDEICERVEQILAEQTVASLRPVINATGIVLHTNLGRAPLPVKAAQAAYAVAQSYSTLEYDFESGQRGSRYSHVDVLLAGLTGAEAAMVVNNNAAAVLLILSALAKEKEVVVSRGELVEIGGSFRVPDIMVACGAILREVGTTNKTHPQDYKDAVNENTAALMKVHTSNFRIKGFAESVPLEELAYLAHAHELPLIEDLGSGALFSLAPYGFPEEPSVCDSIRAGVDILCFSGDKLLGGPQAGIILGKKTYIDLLKKHPLTRAMRVDKMTLAALEATLRLYLDRETAEAEIPVLSMLAAEQKALHAKAQRLFGLLSANQSVAAELIEGQAYVGGGSLPDVAIPTVLIALAPQQISVEVLEERMRKRPIPVIGRIYKGRYLLDVRTMLEEEFAVVAEALAEATNEK